MSTCIATGDEIPLLFHCFIISMLPTQIIKFLTHKTNLYTIGIYVLLYSHDMNQNMSEYQEPLLNYMSEDDV